MNKKRTAVIIGFTIFIFIFGLCIGYVKTNNTTICSSVPVTAHTSTKTASTRLANKAFHAIGKALNSFHRTVVKAVGLKTKHGKSKRRYDKM